MSYETPLHRRQAVDAALNALHRAERVVLTTHVNADGDGAGSQVALGAWCRARGKKAWIVNPTSFPKSLSFLLPEEGWVLDAGSSQARSVVGEADLAVVLDTGEKTRIGAVHDLFRPLPTVILDHHPQGSDSIEGIVLRDPDACATGELVFDLLLEAGGPWPPAAVQGLYVAVMADTGSFRFSNSSPAAHRIVADLIEKGADPEGLYRMVYSNVPLRRFQLLQAALGHLEVDPGGRMAWITVPTDAFQRLGARPEDIEGVVDYPRDIEGVEIAMLFRETAKGSTKISFRSNGGLDVNDLARRFGGGGHAKASGAVMEGPLEEVRESVLEEVRSVLGGRIQDHEG